METQQTTESAVVSVCNKRLHRPWYLLKPNLMVKRYHIILHLPLCILHLALCLPQGKLYRHFQRDNARHHAAKI